MDPSFHRSRPTSFTSKFQPFIKSRLFVNNLHDKHVRRVTRNANIRKKNNMRCIDPSVNDGSIFGAARSIDYTVPSVAHRNLHVEELEAAIKKLKSGKARDATTSTQSSSFTKPQRQRPGYVRFFTSWFRRSKLPKTWRRATVVALPKPNKPAQDPKSYRPISLLCVPFKILERLIHSRIDPVVDPQLPWEQAGFRRGRSTVDQVTLLTQ